MELHGRIFLILADVYHLVYMANRRLFRLPMYKKNAWYMAN